MRIPTLGALTLAAAAAVVAVPTTATAAAPTANPDSVVAKFETAKVIDVIANDTNPDTGETLTVTGKTDGANGTVACTTAGSCTYTPKPGWTGTDTFTYTLSASGPTVETATGTVTVKTVNVFAISLASTPANLVATKDNPLPTHTVVGKVTTSGSAPLSGIDVELWARPTGTTEWTKVGADVSDVDGKISVENLAPTSHTSYQWKSATKNSSIRSVDVTPYLTSNYGDKSFARGGSFKVTGESGPVAQGQAVLLQQKLATGWTTVQTKTFGLPASNHVATYAFDAIQQQTSGAFPYRVVVPESVENGRLKATAGQTTIQAYDAKISKVETVNSDEFVTVKNLGAVPFNLKDWTLTGSGQNVILPKRLVGTGVNGVVRIHTGKGTNTSKDFYLRLPAAIWPKTGTVTLTDNDGVVMGAPFAF